MFPLKTLVVAVIIAIAFGPRVSACPAHNHMQTATAPVAVEEQATVATPAAPQATKAEAAEAQAAEIASASKGKPSAEN